MDRRGMKVDGLFFEAARLYSHALEMAEVIPSALLSMRRRCIARCYSGGGKEGRA